MRHVIGIDAGGTKTVCVLADEAGTLLAEARGAGANLYSAGEDGVEAMLRGLIGEVFATLSAHPAEWRPAAIGIGMAGVDREEDLAAVRRILARIGVDARTVIVNDAVIALVAGAGRASGIVVIAGTGSIAYGRTADGRAARSGGWGHVLADEGSGYWVGRQALRAVVREGDGRGPATRLTPVLLDHYGVTRSQDLPRVVYERPLQPAEIAALVPFVRDADLDGDPVARGILDEAARELAGAATAVLTRLNLSDQPFVLVLAGGMFRALPRLAVEVPRQFIAAAPRARIVTLDTEPAMGAVALALDALHGGAVIPAYV